MSAPRRSLGIDLAIRDTRDIGVAIVGDDGVQLRAVPWSGRPEVAALAAWIREVAVAHAVQVVSIDGPLGWKSPTTDSPHSRRSERALRAPGKTGWPPDGVKPAAYLGFTRFSIALFEHLTMEAGWRLPDDPRSGADGAIVVTECFPTAIWRGLGLAPLVGKQRATAADIELGAQRLAHTSGLPVPTPCSHDALQAVVAGYAGWRFARGDDRVLLAGDPPFRLDDTWREGYILSIAPTGGD